MSSVSPAGQVYVPALGRYVSAYTARQYSASVAAEKARSSAAVSSGGGGGFEVKVGGQGFSFQGTQAEAEAFAQKTAEAQAKSAQPAGFEVQTKQGGISVSAENYGRFVANQALQAQLHPAENRVSYVGKAEPVVNPNAPLKMSLQTSQVQGQRAFYAAAEKQAAANEASARSTYGAGVTAALTAPIELIPLRETPIGLATGVAKGIAGGVGGLFDVPVELGKGVSRGMVLGDEAGSIGFSRVGREAVEGTVSLVGEAASGNYEAIGSLAVAAGSLGLAAKGLFKTSGAPVSDTVWIKAETVLGEKEVAGDLVKIKGTTSMVSKPILVEENLLTGSKTEVFATAKPEWIAVVKAEGGRFGSADVSTLAKAISERLQGKPGAAPFDVESISFSKGVASLIEKKTPSEFAQALGRGPSYAVKNVAEFKGTGFGLNSGIKIVEVPRVSESPWIPREAAAPSKLFLLENFFSKGFVSEKVYTPGRNLFKPLESQGGFSAGLFASRNLMKLGETDVNAVSGVAKAMGRKNALNIRVLEKVGRPTKTTAVSGVPAVLKPPKGFGLTEFADWLGRSMKGVSVKEETSFVPNDVGGFKEASSVMAKLLERTEPKSREFSPVALRLKERQSKGLGQGLAPLVIEETRGREKVVPEPKVTPLIGEGLFDEGRKGTREVPFVSSWDVNPSGEKTGLFDLQRQGSVQPNQDISIEETSTKQIMTPPPNWFITSLPFETPPGRARHDAFDFFKEKRRRGLKLGIMGKSKGSTSLKPTRDWGTELIQGSKTGGLLKPLKSVKGFLHAFKYGGVFTGKRRGK